MPYWVYSQVILLRLLLYVRLERQDLSLVLSVLPCRVPLCQVHYKGRVNSIRFLIGGGLQPVGAFAGAAIAETYGLSFLFLSLGLLPILCSAAVSFLPKLKNLDGNLSELHNKIKKNAYNKDLTT